MSEKFKIIIRVIISFSLGAIFNKVFSSTNRLVGATDEYSYEIPFIYILTISEILIILATTSIIGIFLYFYFNKSKSSQNDISKIYRLIIESEILLFSFIIGTSKWQKIISKDIFNINQLINNHSLNEVILFFIFIAFSSIVLSANEIKSKKLVKLYSSSWWLGWKHCYLDDTLLETINFEKFDLKLASFLREEDKLEKLIESIVSSIKNDLDKLKANGVI